MVKFSIIIVSYNGQKYINNCINNIKKQTFKNYEIIFIDDGSTDDTKNIIKSFNDVNYYSIKHSGVSHARNYGISKVKGEYFLFVDVDDYIDNNLLEVLDKKTRKQLDLIKYKYEMVTTYDRKQMDIKKENMNVLKGTDMFKYLCSKKEAVDLICIYLYNTKFWRENKFLFKEGTYHEDFGLIPYVILKAKNALSLEFLGYYYVQTNDSITRTTDKEKNIKKAYDYLLHYDFLYVSVNNSEEFNKEIKKLFNSYIANALILKLKTLYDVERKKYFNELKKRKVFDNLRSDTIGRKIKKIMLKLCPNIYLRVAK